MGRSWVPAQGVSVEIDRAFRQSLRSVDLEAVAASPDVVYVLDRELVLRGFNPAWRRFALENGGAEILGRYGIGRPVLDAMCSAAKTFFGRHYQRAIKQREPFELDYECSSSTLFRTFHMVAQPLANAHGLVVRNRLLEERPHDRRLLQLCAHYFDRHDIAVQCCHCRRAQDQRDKARWDWVPEFLDDPYPHTVFALCPSCYKHFYPAATLVT